MRRQAILREKYLKDIGYAKSLRETIANTEVQTHGPSVCSLEPECEGADRLLGVSLEKCRYALRAETRHYDSKGRWQIWHTKQRERTSRQVQFLGSEKKYIVENKGSLEDVETEVNFSVVYSERLDNSE